MRAAVSRNEPKRGETSSQSPTHASQPSSTCTISTGSSSRLAASTFSATSASVTSPK
jgi:hypothetical protein